MIHRERLAAIEKGIEIPVVEQEVTERTWNVQRFLLLAGWSWIAIGIGVGVVLSILTTNSSPQWVNEVPPPGTEFAGLIPIGIGIAHLITHCVGDRRERELRKPESQPESN